jgi:hypothetical protein
MTTGTEPKYGLEEITQEAKKFGGESHVDLQSHTKSTTEAPIDRGDRFNFNAERIGVDPEWLKRRHDDFLRYDNLPWINHEESREREKDFAEKKEKTPRQVLSSKFENLIALKTEYEYEKRKVQPDMQVLKRSGYLYETGIAGIKKFLHRYEYNTPEKMALQMDRSAFVRLEYNANQVGISLMSEGYGYTPPKTSESPAIRKPTA